MEPNQYYGNLGDHTILEKLDWFLKKNKKCYIFHSIGVFGSSLNRLANLRTNYTL